MRLNDLEEFKDIIYIIESKMEWLHYDPKETKIVIFNYENDNSKVFVTLSPSPDESYNFVIQTGRNNK